MPSVVPMFAGHPVDLVRDVEDGVDLLRDAQSGRRHVRRGPLAAGIFLDGCQSEELPLGVPVGSPTRPLQADRRATSGRQ